MNETASMSVREAERSGGVGPQAPRLPSVGANAARARAYRSAAAWIDQTLGCFAEAVERMDEARFLAEHQAAHDAPRSASVDMVATVLEREWWRRWPEGREE